MTAKLRQSWETLRARLSPEKIGRGREVVIFSKPDCPLCEVAKAHLHRLQSKWRFELREVNLAGDEKLLAEYGGRVPLVWVNGQLACKYKIDEQALRQRLARAGHVAREE